MKNTRFILGIGLLALIGSCKKPDTTPTTVSTYPTYSSMDAIYKSLEVKPKYVTVNGATGGTFYGTSGTRYVIPPNCLKDGAGNPVTTNVQFEVAEYLKKGDMVFSKMLPLSNGEPLLSGGQISIKATLSGMPIYLKSSGCNFTATIPKDKDTTTGMQFFIGQQTTKGNDSNNVNWNRIDSAAGGAGGVPWGHIVYNGDTISIISDSLSLCNADRFLTSPIDYKTFKVTPSAPGGVSITSSTQLTGYAFYDNYKSAYPMYFYNGVFDESHVPGIPVHFAVYGLINNRFYAGVVAATPENGGNYTVTLTEADPAAFKAQLNNLTK